MINTTPPSVAVSILNWNSAEATLDCVRSLLRIDQVGFVPRIVVVDNGSFAVDVERLRAGLSEWPEIELLRLASNHGFAGGHNRVLERCLADGTDYVWLLNNDTVVAPSALARLVFFLETVPRCGAVSPVIRALHDEQVMDFCGARHDWPALDSQRPSLLDEARAMQASVPEDVWVHGTAVLLRTAALREIGLLDEAYFAYYEDDDLGVRLSRSGWSSRICFDADIRHARRTVLYTQRPAYYFYLMARNAFLFWGRHALAPHRRRLRSRLLSRFLMEAAVLRARGQREKSYACLVGAVHGLRGRTGPPSFNERPPRWIALASRLPYRMLKCLS